MKTFFAGSVLVLAIAPWVFTILIAPMTWLFFDVNIFPANMQKMDNGGWPFLFIPLGVVWTWFLFSLGSAID